MVRKSCVDQLRLVVYHIIYRVFYIPCGAGFLPSTASHSLGRFTRDPETDSSHLKTDGWKLNLFLGWPIFTGYVSFREGNYFVACEIPECSIDLDLVTNL